MIDFIKKIAANKHLSWIQDNTIFAARHGSHAYNCNVESSDEDFKGICIPPSKYFFGFMNKFEQAELKDPDAVIYDIRKFFKLAADCNPNIIELLWLDPSDILYVHPLFEDIINKRELFLSKKIKYTMGGYAHSQIHRIKLHKSWLLSPVTKPPSRKELGLPAEPEINEDQYSAVTSAISKYLDRFNFNFLEELGEEKKIGLRNIVSDMLVEMKICSDDLFVGAAKAIGLDDNLIEVMKRERDYQSRIKQYNSYKEWEINRNPERAKMEAKFGYDLKHAYHVVRLYTMCEEVLLTGKVIVKRPDREMLLSIRSGAWPYEKFLDWADQQEQKINKLYDECKVLPYTPDKNKLDNLCIDTINKFYNEKNM